MQRPLIGSIFLFTWIVAAPSIANEPTYGVLGRIGNASQSISQANFSERDISFAVGGIYRLNANFAAELRYDQFGTVAFGSASDRGELSASALSAGAIASLPVSTDISIYGKGGVANWRNQLDDPLGRTGSDGNNFYYGFGGEYQLSSTAAIVLEYSAIELEAYATYQMVDYRISSLSLGVNFYFH